MGTTVGLLSMCQGQFCSCYQFVDDSYCNTVKLALRHHRKYYSLQIYRVTVTNDRQYTVF